MTDKPNIAPMLNLYPDSMGGTLSEVVEILRTPDFGQCFQSLYVLPSVFHTDLDRGFSVISYDLNEELARPEDIVKLRDLGMDLKLDFILNHGSVLSKEFQDLVTYGQESIYKDFFIPWNDFWEGYGEMTDQGYIQPEEQYIKDMFFRKPGLPILMVGFPNGEQVPYWNTFYQEVKYPSLDAQDIMKLTGLQYGSAHGLAQRINRQIEEGTKPGNVDFGTKDFAKNILVGYLETNKRYLGQMDLNIKSPLVWDFYDQVLQQLSEYGARIIRLDAFAYAPKEPGARNFLNDPGTWELLDRVRQLADRYDLTLLPEIHASYYEKNYQAIAARGYMTYDFFLPGLIIDALENADGTALKDWAQEILSKGIQTVNMLGCHDGIPMLDLKGLIPEDRIQKLIDTIIARGGKVKDLHGQKNVYYQVNATYYSALGEDDRKMLMARALHLFMPGKPQVWYLDLFLGANDYEAVLRAGQGGHKEINRTNLTRNQIQDALGNVTVQQQLEMLRFRTTFPAFAHDSEISVKSMDNKMRFIWSKDGYHASLEADLSKMTFEIRGTGSGDDLILGKNT